MTGSSGATFRARVQAPALIEITTRILWLTAAVVFCFALVGVRSVEAQSQLTPEQQRMLNQLPASQRQQALDAIRRLQNSGVTSQTDASDRSGVEEQPRVAVPSQDDESDVYEVPRAEPSSRLVIDFTPKEFLTPEEERDIEEDPIVSQFRGSHLFVLNDDGVLSLNELALIPLLGLDEADIERRLRTETYLSAYDISVRILAIEPIGREALQRFGYSMFEPDEQSFDPPMTGPVPQDYVLGPGDTVRVQLFGNVNGIYDLEVSRDGILNIPDIGPITVAGQPYSAFRSDLEARVNEMLIGTRISATMGELRTIRIFVLGDSNQPGSYVVSSLSTISSALYRSGGISEVGSLRDIQLKRGGQEVASLDLYDLLLRGDTSGDRRLQPGDVIFIPPVGDTVGVDGAVKRPAIYETKGRATVADAIALAGGLLPDALTEGVTVESIGAGQRRRVIAVNLNNPSASDRRIGGGDMVTIPGILPELEDSVELAGHVHRPGAYQWFSGMRLTDLVSSADAVKPGVDWDYALVRRENTADRSISVMSADLGTALRDNSSSENIVLDARDTVHIFSLEYGRQRIVAPLLEDLRLQARSGVPYQEVQISGRVRAPGDYPLEPNMRVSDLVRAGGNLNEGAYIQNAELTRFSVVNGGAQGRETISVNLAAALRGELQADLELRPHDHLNVVPIPEWGANWSVKIDGEVRFPGEYQIRRGENLSSLLERVGGVTVHAFPEGAVFLRESLKDREREQIELLTRRLESDLASLALESRESSGGEALSTGQTLLDQLRQTEPIGRLVIDLDGLMSDSRIDSVKDIELRDGDTLLVPTRSQEVTVIGEVQHNTSHLYQPGLMRDDYLELSGGLTRRADRKLTYIVRASGAVVSANRSRWFGRSHRMEIRPGDTIVVPLETDRIRPLTFWTNVAQIVYQGAIAVAAVKTFDN